jgi:hypothetical protein
LDETKIESYTEYKNSSPVNEHEKKDWSGHIVEDGPW